MEVLLRSLYGATAVMAVPRGPHCGLAQPAEVLNMLNVSAVPPRRSAVLTVFGGATAINDGITAEPRRSRRCHCGLCRTSTLGRVHTTALGPEPFRNATGRPCSHLFHCVQSFRNEPTTSRCDRSGTVPERVRLALWCERTTGRVPVATR